MSDLTQWVALNEVLMINVFTVDYFLLQVVTFTAFSVLKESFFFFFFHPCDSVDPFILFGNLCAY